MRLNKNPTKTRLKSRFKRRLIDLLRRLRPNPGEPYQISRFGALDNQDPGQVYGCKACERRGNYHRFWVSLTDEENMTGVRNTDTGEFCLVPACPDCMHIAYVPL